jgi:signal transduction histidine kinase
MHYPPVPPRTDGLPVLRLNRSNAWIAFGAVMAAAIVVEQAVGTPMRHYVVYMAIAAIAMAGMVWGIRVNRPSYSRPWKWILGNQVLFLLADVVFYTRHDVLHINDFPTPADPLYIAHYGLLFGALVFLVRRRSGDTHDRSAALDAAIAAIGAGLISWLAWVGPTLATSMPLLTRFTIAIYPVTDVALLAIGLRLVSGRGARPFSFWCLNAALVCLFSADSLLGWQQSRGTYVTHNFDDALWLAFTVLMSLAAMHPSMNLVSATPATQRRRRAGVRSLALWTAAAVPPFGLLLADDTSRSGEVAIAIGALAMYSLVILRLHLASREEARAHQIVESQRVELQEALGLLHQATDARAQLIDGIVTARENERSWVAAELHDGPIQSLAAIGISMDRLSRRLERSGDCDSNALLSSQRDDLSTVISGLRRLMTELRPPALDESGLTGALRDYIAGFIDDGIACDADLRLDEHRVDDRTETIVYRVTQEALTNVRKHSGATRCRVALWNGIGTLMLEVQDNGRGFDATRQIDFVADHHFGLSTMRERVEVAGGTWCLESGPGGTIIRASLPASERGVLVKSLA